MSEKLLITGLKNTCLQLTPLTRALDRHFRKLRYPVDLIFDSRLKKLFGFHKFKDSRHLIKISIPKNQVRDDNEASIHLFLATILHELKHAMQHESGTYSDKNESKIKTKEWSDHCSSSEVEARVYELTFVLGTVKLYKQGIE